MSARSRSAPWFGPRRKPVYVFPTPEPFPLNLSFGPSPLSLASPHWWIDYARLQRELLELYYPGRYRVTGIRAWGVPE